MKSINFVIAGLGGQGILFLTKIIAKTALRNGFALMGAETHGMAQRGGSVISHLRLGNVNSSLVKPGSAHYLLSLSESETYRNLPFVAPKGQIFSDSNRNQPETSVRQYLENNAISYYSLPAGQIALELGAPVSSNLAMIGYFAAFQEKPFSAEDFSETIQEVSPDSFRDINMTVFDRGLSMGRDRLDV